MKLSTKAIGILLLAAWGHTSFAEVARVYIARGADWSGGCYVREQVVSQRSVEEYDPYLDRYEYNLEDPEELYYRYYNDLLHHNYNFGPNVANRLPRIGYPHDYSDLPHYDYDPRYYNFSYDSYYQDEQEYYEFEEELYFRDIENRDEYRNEIDRGAWELSVLEETRQLLVPGLRVIRFDSHWDDKSELRYYHLAADVEAVYHDRESVVSLKRWILSLMKSMEKNSPEGRFKLKIVFSNLKKKTYLIPQGEHLYSITRTPYTPRSPLLRRYETDLKIKGYCSHEFDPIEERNHRRHFGKHQYHGRRHDAQRYHPTKTYEQVVRDRNKPWGDYL